LPSAAEYYAYAEELDRLVPNATQIRERAAADETIPPVVDGEPYPTGLVIEWSYQVDDPGYWATLLSRARRGREWRRLCFLPPYRRERGRVNCEYFLVGRSCVQKEVQTKNSKGGDIVNPDQGFRLVLDYRSAVRRFLEAG
jgi:hypothetical protein